jgi:hypothetical protein
VEGIAVTGVLGTGVTLAEIVVVVVRFFFGGLGIVG